MEKAMQTRKRGIYGLRTDAVQGREEGMAHGAVQKQCEIAILSKIRSIKLKTCICNYAGSIVPKENFENPLAKHARGEVYYRRGRQTSNEESKVRSRREDKQTFLNLFLEMPCQAGGHTRIKFVSAEAENAAIFKCGFWQVVLSGFCSCRLGREKK